MSNTRKRTERDTLGSLDLPADALYGIHALRAQQNFPDATPFHQEWFQALASVKKACYITAKDFQLQASQKYKLEELPLKFPETKVLDALIASSEELEKGNHFDSFIVPAISGGAGTSINMNVNEILANLALIKLGENPGQYEIVDPIESANIYQSTNDVIPTALKVAIMRLLENLEESINQSRQELERLEKANRNALRIGYTQMQEAVPSSYGRLFSTYNDALSRDWWRISKCFERIKVVNLGGSAIGTGMTVPKFFIAQATRNLQSLTNLPITRGENLQDATANLDSFVEVHGILKAHAVNLEKISNDFRLLSSDLLGEKDLSIPEQQVGSSIMPGKINPVIPEFIISAAHKIYANDQMISSLSAQTCLDLNAYLPTIGHGILESIKLLIACNQSLKSKMLAGTQVHAEQAAQKLMKSPSITTALVSSIGYHKAGELAQQMKSAKMDIFQANEKLQILTEKKLNELLSTENLLKEGFTLKDITEPNSTEE